MTIAANNGYLSSILSGVGVCFSLITLVLVFIARKEAADKTTPSVHCLQPVCRAGYLTERGTCEYEVKAKNQACVSPCHIDGATSTYCDGNGTCAGTDVTECLGRCQVHASVNTLYGDNNASECDNTTLQFHSYVRNGTTGAANFNQDQAFYSTVLPECVFGSCLWHAVALRLYRKTDVAALKEIHFGMLDRLGGCMALLDVTNAGCIQAEEHALDPVLSASFFSKVLNQTVAHGTNFTSIEFQGSVCTYRYHCAAFNQTLFSDTRFAGNTGSTLTKKRGLDAGSETTTTTTAQTVVRDRIGRVLSRLAHHARDDLLEYISHRIDEWQGEGVVQ